MKPRQDIDWGHFCMALRVEVFRRNHLAAQGEGEAVSTRRLAREAGVPRRTLRRALAAQPWAYGGCKYESFRRLCQWMEQRPGRFLRFSAIARPFAQAPLHERAKLLAHYPGILT